MLRASRVTRHATRYRLHATRGMLHASRGMPRALHYTLCALRSLLDESLVELV